MTSQPAQATTHPARSRLHLDLRSWVALVVLLLGIAQLFLGALRVGVTWDEPIHVERTQGLFDSGWYLPPDELADRGAEAELRRYVYGPTFSLLAHGVNVLARVEEPGVVATTAAAYAGRHLVLAALGTAAALAIGVAVWALTGSRRSALWSAAALVALPAWTGHAMFNIKDLPAAVGYTAMTVALVLASVADPPVGLRRVRGPLVAVGAAVGVLLGVGTRLAFWVPLTVAVLSFLVLWAVRARARLAVWRAGPLTVLAGSLVGLAATALAYPRIVARPLTVLVGSVQASSAFPWRGYTLTAGQLLPAQDLPWWYLPVWFGARTPILLGLLVLLGVALVLAGLRPSTPDPAGWTRWIPSDTTAGALLLLQQAVLLSGGAIVLGSVMYDGLRQHLYVVPALAGLAGLAAHRLTSRAVASEARTSPAPRWRQHAGVAVVGLALLVPTVEQLLLFPYNYTYVNAVAGLGGVGDRWETDYWRAAGQEAVTRVPVDVELRCSALELPRTGAPAGAWPCGPDIVTFLHLRGTATGSTGAAEGDSDDRLWVIGRRREGARPPAGCTPADDVTRWVRGESVVMMHVLVCDRDAF